MFPPKKKPQGSESDEGSGVRERPTDDGDEKPGDTKPGFKKRPGADKPKPGEDDKKPGKQASDDDGWKDGDSFNAEEFSHEHGSAAKRAKGDEEGGFGGKPHAMDRDGDGQHDGDDWNDGEAFDPNADEAGDGEVKPGSKGMRVEPHESGAGHKVHFHEEVHADVPADGDYQHHVMEHAKHYAGYLTHKDADPEKAEAHRQAANLHARVGNALHAGGDTSPRRASSGAPGMQAPPGAQNGPGKPQVGPDGERLADPNGEPGFDFGEGSPGDDATGNPVPAAPDRQRNLPGRDSMIEADRSRSGKKFPPLPLMGKSAVFFRPIDLAAAPLRKSYYVGPRGGKWADAAHTIPWHEPDELPGMREVHHQEMEDRKKPYKVTATSYSRYRAPGGETRTTFLIEDPERPEPRYHKYEGRGKTPGERRSHALKQHAERFGIKQHVTHTESAEAKASKKKAKEQAQVRSRWKKVSDTHYEHSSGAKAVKEGDTWKVHHKGESHGLPKKASMDHAEKIIGEIEFAQKFKETKKSGDPAVRAYAAGAAAFAAGKKGVPALDSAVTKLLAEADASGVSGSVLAVLKAWARGWHEANMKAPVDYDAPPTKKSIKLSLSKSLFDYTW